MTIAQFRNLVIQCNNLRLAGESVHPCFADYFAAVHDGTALSREGLEGMGFDVSGDTGASGPRFAVSAKSARIVLWFDQRWRCNYHLADGFWEVAKPPITTLGTLLQLIERLEELPQ